MQSDFNNEMNTSNFNNRIKRKTSALRFSQVHVEAAQEGIEKFQTERRFIWCESQKGGGGIDACLCKIGIPSWVMGIASGDVSLKTSGKSSASRYRNLLCLKIS